MLPQAGRSLHARGLPKIPGRQTHFSEAEDNTGLAGFSGLTQVKAGRRPRREAVRAQGPDAATNKDRTAG
jgi:hypothetical protein